MIQRAIFHARIILCILVLLSFVACDNKPTPTQIPIADQWPEASEYTDVVITLERTMCFGTCPAYRLTIAGNGTVIYEGYHDVQVEGGRVGTISPDQLQELIAEFQRVEFFSFQDYVAHYVTDAPTAITSITLDGKTKVVRHYFGDESAPQELIELENKIDEITNSKQWIGD